MPNMDLFEVACKKEEEKEVEPKSMFKTLTPSKGQQKPKGRENPRGSLERDQTKHFCGVRWLAP
jgi:hypothetical protein